ALVLTSPDVYPVRGPQQLDRDGRALAPTGPPHAPADQVRHAEGAPQRCWILRGPAKAANGVARLHAESLDSAEAGDDRLSEPVSEVGGCCVGSLEVQDGDARRWGRVLRHSGDAARAAEPGMGEPCPPVRENGPGECRCLLGWRVESSPLDDVTGLAPRVDGGGRGPFPRVADQVHRADPRSPEAARARRREAVPQRGRIGSARLPPVAPGIPKAPWSTGGRLPFVFGGQAAAALPPRAIRHCLRPQYAGHRPLIRRRLR